MNIITLMALTITKAEIGYTSGITDEKTTLSTILDMVYLWAGIVAVVVLVVAGLLFVTSRGDATQMKRSKDAIRGAVIGLVVVITAFAITKFVIGGVQG